MNDNNNSELQERLLEIIETVMYSEEKFSNYQIVEMLFKEVKEFYDI